MKYNTHNHINISNVNTDKMNCMVACIADTVLKPLYDFGKSRELFDYLGAVEMVGEWAKEFYIQYESKFEDWDAFEETEDNIYNAMSWDEFATYWANDRFKTYLSQTTDDPIKAVFGNSRFPKLIIVIKGNTVSAVYSTIPIVYAKIDNDQKYQVEIFESDSVADDLCSLFDSSETIDALIIKQLRQLGF